MDRREQILSTAEQVLAEDGLGAATVRAVAARAGIGASTVRCWFPTQEQPSAATECVAQFLPRLDQVPAVREQQLNAWLVLVTSAVDPSANAMGRALYDGRLAVSRASIERWLHLLADEGASDRSDVDRAAPSLLTRVDSLMMGLALPGSTLDLETAHQVLRDDVDALLTTGP